ncbi:hypothetical protein T4E_11528 [Trichinella pseudospiralis]|uniref:Uncharacterized protein n=1 Tax=Trichinella pseudospiralis TaxID=6337 RepID=A0A0V0XCS8_TRIPS|nr:hypothetical protein T4E_11528 [Trichinella pseudospiralis]
MSFVQNRVESIQQLLELGSWRQLPKRSNHEIPSVKVLTALVENTNFSSERYEYFDRLLRISAYCTRFLEGLVCLNYLMLTNMRKEIQQLSNGKLISTNSRLCQLDPTLDKDGLWRVNRRSKNFNLPETAKHL